MLQLSIIFQLVVVSWVVSEAKTCNDSYSCVNVSSITDSSSIACYGYFSCSGIESMQYLGSSPYGIKCYGSFSCYNISSIQTTGPITRATSIACDGLFSCAFVSKLETLRGSITCNGEKSCYNSKIISNHQNMYCYGDQSCANSIIIDIGSVTLSGHGSGYNTIFNNTDSILSSTFYFESSESGNNSTIICNTNAKCDIYCYGNACNNLTLISICDNDNDSNCSYLDAFSVTCYDAEKSMVCPNGTEYNVLLPSLLSNNISITSTIDNSIDTCMNAISRCDDYKECSQTIQLDGPLCCNAYQSCYNATTINTTMTSFSTTSTAIRCDGAYSCDNIDSSIIANNGGNIYLSASYAASYNSLESIETKNEYDIIVTGYFGGSSLNLIKNGNNLYCLASYSCQSSNVENFNNVWFYAINSGSSSTVSNIDGNVYCYGYLVCSSQIRLNNINGNVYVIGTEAGRSAQISNVSKLFCFGEKSCHGSDLLNVNEILIDGKDAISLSTISSNTNGAIGHGIDDGYVNDIRLNISGEHGDNFHVHCGSYDKCIINCESDYGCLNMHLHCYHNSECVVNCGIGNNNNSIACPNVTYAVYYENTTDLPSIAPSRLPYPWNTTTAHYISSSRMPSGMPSDAPTNVTFIENENDSSSENDLEFIIIVITICTVCVIICIIIIVIIVVIIKQHKKANNNNEKIKKLKKNNNLKQGAKHVAQESVNIAEMLDEMESPPLPPVVPDMNMNLNTKEGEKNDEIETGQAFDDRNRSGPDSDTDSSKLYGRENAVYEQETQNGGHHGEATIHVN